MRLAYLSHSLCAERQALFAKALRSKLTPTGGDVLEVYPARWGRLERKGGWHVEAEGDMVRFNYEPAAWRVMAEWHPDVVLLQQEAYCKSAWHAASWCAEQDVPLVTFSWENTNAPTGPMVANVLGRALFNVWGNRDAMRLGLGAGARAQYNAVLPQVGIDHAMFKPQGIEVEWDVLFAGRKGDPMKGEAVLDEAVRGSGYRVFKKWQAGFFPYEHLPRVYAGATVQCVPSVDVPGYAREQFAPAVTIEGLMCGTPVVTTDQAAIAEWLQGSNGYADSPCPAAWYARMGDPSSLRRCLEEALMERIRDPAAWQKRRDEGRAWAVRHFSNEAVANAYVTLIKAALEGRA